MDSLSQSSCLAHLRHELRTPINAIIGFSEMLLEEIELEATEAIPERAGIGELQHIRECGIELLSAVNNLLNPDRLEDSEWNLKQLVKDSTLQAKLQQPTQAAIAYCERLLCLDFVRAIPELQQDIHKIEKSARLLLTMTEDIAGIIEESTVDIDFQVDAIDEVVIKELEAQISAYNQLHHPHIDLKSEEVKESSSFPPSTILLVDDNPSNLDLLSWQIEGQGHKVVTASNGREALHKIQAENYDLILLDMIMPEVNGYQLLSLLRNSAYSQWQHIPVIMISALDEIDSVVKCIELGAEDYLPKPFNPILLRARINACLEKKRLRDREASFVAQITQAHQEITKLNELLQAENSRLSAEVEVTQRLQSMILPKDRELSQIDSLEIAGFMQPADEVGGDYYDVLHDNNRIKLGIGDVTGHGLESGVLMLMVQTAVRTLMESNQTDPQKFLDIINRTIYKNIQRMNCDKNMTLCLVDYYQGKLTLSGQHEEIVIVTSQGEIRRVDTIDLGFPIGLEENISDFISHTEIELNLGDVVILYTDGITEAENYLGDYYGIERLCRIVEQHKQRSAKEIRQAVIEDVKRYIDKHKVYDDITLVIVKKK